MQDSLLNGVDGIFVTNPTNIRYLTGFTGVSPEEREAFALITKRATYLFTNALYREAVRMISKPKHTHVETSRENPVSYELARICGMEKIKKLAFEDTNVTVAELSKLKETLTKVALVPTRDRVETLRMVKRAHEIEAIRTSATLTDACFDYILHRVRPGVTERIISWEIEKFFWDHGAGNAFSPIVAFGQHTSMPHYATSKFSNTECKKQDIILIDFGARMEGYCADMTRMIFIGTPKPEWITAYTAIHAANKKVLELLRDGERNGATLDAAAREVIAESGFPVYPHSLGHAVGLDIHEAPRLTVTKSEIVKPGMVVTIEPGIYVEGAYGVRIEDLIHITQHGIETLSKSTKELTRV